MVEQSFAREANPWYMNKSNCPDQTKCASYEWFRTSKYGSCIASHCYVLQTVFSKSLRVFDAEISWAKAKIGVLTVVAATATGSRSGSLVIHCL